MSCAAGFPEGPCPFGALDKGDRVTRRRCGPCKHYVPPPHILAWCMLWDREHVLCRLPKAACETCPEKSPVSPMRAEGYGKIDWKDPEQVRKYYRERAAADPDRKIKSIHVMDRFLDKNPDYFKNYYLKNKEKFAEAKRRSRANKKGAP